MDYYGEQQQQQQVHQGVLWKRRDVFKNRWRPRWFCLQPSQGVLTYYLLTQAPPPPIIMSSNNNNNNSNNSSLASTGRTSGNSGGRGRFMAAATRNAAAVAAAGTRSSCYGTSAASSNSDEGQGEVAQNAAQSEQQQQGLVGPPPPSAAADDERADDSFPASLTNTIGLVPLLRDESHHRDRATSWDSQVSENTVDYDVVPRGTIYLLGCTVEMNESLSKPREHLFAFTIRSPNTKESEIHLAARTAQTRRVWVEKLLRVCDCAATTTSSSNTNNEPVPVLPPLPSTVSTRTRRRTTTTTTTRGSAASLSSPTTVGGAVPTVEEVHEYQGNDELDNEQQSATDFFHEAAQEEEEGNENAAAAAAAAAATSSVKEEPLWRSTSPASTLYKNVPQTLARDIQQRLEKYLPMTDEPAQGDWTKLFERNGHEAYVTVLPTNEQQQEAPGATAKTNVTSKGATTTQGTAVVKTIAYLEHSPRQVFNLLMDPSRRKEYESDVRSSRRLQTYNPHAFIDLTMYNPIWPMSARELATAVHWQVMSKTQLADDGDLDDEMNRNSNADEEQRALVIMAFSCPQAQELQQPLESRHVVQANLLLSLFVLRPMVNHRATQMTRLVSLSLDPRVGGFNPTSSGGGRFSTNRHGRLQKFVLSQLAGLPTVVARYLDTHEPLPPSARLTGPLEDELIIRDIIQHLPNTLQQKQNAASGSRTNGQQDQDTMNGGRDDDDDDDSSRWDRSSAGPSAFPTSTSFKHPPIERQATFLLAPVLLFQVLQWNALVLSSSVALVIFCIAVFQAIRQVTLSHVELSAPETTKECGIPSRVLGPMTCHLTIDLKGILRFVTNKKEEREELGQGTAEVSVIHLVASALARALKKEALLRQRRITLPCLCIDKVVDASSEPIRVSVSENGGSWFTLDDVDTRPVQDIADDLAQQEQEQRHRTPAATAREQPILGQCLVLATPDLDQSSDMDFNASVVPSQAHAENVAVVAVIGGVQLEHNAGRRNSTISNAQLQQTNENGSVAAAPPRPVLSLTLTISGPLEHNSATTADFVACRRFAEDVKVLLQFPEMCDN